MYILVTEVTVLTGRDPIETDIGIQYRDKTERHKRVREFPTALSLREELTKLHEKGETNFKVYEGNTVDVTFKPTLLIDLSTRMNS
jgi:hypothetical protein